MGKIQDAQRILQSGGLQPGKHRDLQVAIVELFSQHFAPDSIILYLGDISNKPVIYEKEILEAMGMPAIIHNRLPDAVLYDAAKNLLFLIEAVTSHGPIMTKRFIELKRLLKNCTPKRIYISAFHKFAEYEQYEFPVAWETEVWIAEVPGHMIHYD